MRRTFVTLVALVLTLGLMAPVAAAQTKNFRAHLSGGDEVPAVDSGGQGQAIFRVDGDQVHYMLIVAHLDEITQAHIHCAAAGVNGPVKVFLFGLVPTGVDSNGILSMGSFTAEDFTGACPGIETIDDLVAAMASGGAYVNVHTIDFPGGEIRGQIG
ncbi:MAG: CHRD domain-containing protein [Acidimicrobiia bacterium]